MVPENRPKYPKAAFLKQIQMFSSGSNDAAQGYPVIESGKRAAVVNSQCQQISIGDLVVAHDATPANDIVTAKADVARPKCMVNIAASQSQFGPYDIKAGCCMFGIPGQIKHPQHPVFGYRTGGNLQARF